MSFEALFLVFISALFHVGWNFWVKNSKNKQIYIWWMFTSAFLVSSPISIFHFSGWEAMPTKSTLACLSAGFMFSFYQLCTAKAYQKGDLSVVYPLSNLTPLFVPIWAVCFLHEGLSFLGIIGILLTTLGACLIHFSPYSEEKTNKKNKKAALWALSASFFASMGAVLDKAGVDLIPQSLLIHYITLMIMFMLFFLGIWAWIRFPKNIILGEIKKYPIQILIGGLMLSGSFVFFRYGIKICPISYAVAVRRGGILIGVWLGILFFKESHGFSRTMASILIIIGLILLKLA
ncbi:conserved hypothetical protein, membrane [Candidatus Desulfofervidus auxilii]|uniref:EamA domain-containing protein n=2 Tax=Desulfofervidus auxilii TaxID=1621989 RepID=A0A7U4QMN5_DESA2|nr:EamA family transporter [Candidatus Desulfofervidus auxilii]AMM42148.1 conserved hypothetical protein, membrane [Candidatus Desulfofervidus auxilii]CAD7781165.1 EamA-like transporter family protein [Candidatus Methanoperedenaceae archaeon GB50]CAD7782104.1 EamA-like transporter family protein [Candidatus Methanoperedenaceae archaeon GB37]CAD7783386.1 MAG: EamA-like transporter family protein [Candidatus Methanoperedenaceae archaeon GB50]